MDVRLSAEQAALRDSAAQVADRLGVHAVGDLDDAGRTARLDAAVAASGWRELRVEGEDGYPLASAVEVAVVAEELGRGLADTSFWGPSLAAELRRLAGAPPATGPETVLLGRSLAELSEVPVGAPAVVGAPADAVAPDAGGASGALVLMPGAEGFAVGRIELGAPRPGVDLTRPSGTWSTAARATALEGQTRVLGPDDVVKVHSLGLAAACADLVGTMRGAITLGVDYARDRRQYGAAIGSFQAVQHLLADAFVAMEGSRSIALHAAWAVDALAPAGALAAASAAKAYCARAARSVCETVIQVHGGIGNTWECLAHVHLRRALVSGALLGGVDESLARVLGARGVQSAVMAGGPSGLR